MRVGIERAMERPTGKVYFLADGEGIGRALGSLKLHEAYCYLQSLKEVYFAFDLPPGFELEEWDEGRIFCPEWEIRFRRVEGGFCGLFFVEEGNEGAVPGPIKELICEVKPRLYEVEPTQLMLSGVLVAVEGDPAGGFYAAVDIPRRLRYPVPSRLERARHVLIRGLYYLKGGLVSHTRFMEIVEYEEEKER